jgi:hypothetical protein
VDAPGVVEAGVGGRQDGSGELRAEIAMVIVRLLLDGRIVGPPPRYASSDSGYANSLRATGIGDAKRATLRKC